MNNLTNWEDSIKGIIVKNSYSMTSIGTTDGRCEVNFDLVCGELILEIRSLLEQAKLEGRREIIERVREETESLVFINFHSECEKLGRSAMCEICGMKSVNNQALEPILELLTTLDQLGDKDLTK